MIDWLLCTLVKTIGWWLCRLPPAAAVWLGEQIGLLAYWLQPKRTRIGMINVRAAFDGQLTVAQTRRIIRDAYRQFGASMIELLRLPVIDEAYIDRYVAIDGFSRATDRIASGKPVVFLAAHYGNWELSPIASALKGYPVVALARAQNKFPELYKLLVSYRESKGCRIIHKGGAMKRLIEMLKQGTPVGIVGDQASQHGLLVDFFGRPALFATGPFELAYNTQALILPVFSHRLRGPFHRIVVEPPIEPARGVPKSEVVRRGVEQFAQALSRHITEDPHQWLWMHKRWKYTTARRVLVLSDGKAGHLKQSLAVVELLREAHPTLTRTVVEIRYRHRLARALAVCWSAWLPRRFGATACLRWTLTDETAQALLARYADLIVSCGSSLAPVNVLWASENLAKSVVIMNPAPIPLQRFHLVIAPTHDHLQRRANVIQTSGAVSRIRDEDLREAKGRLREHPKFRRDGTIADGRPAVAVFIGGETARYDVSPSFIDALIAQVLAACEAADGWCLVTTSRRTSTAVERLLVDRLGQHRRCRFLLLATCDPIDGTMEGMLGWADASVVTGESVSMVSEACASGRPVVVVEPPLRAHPRATPTKHQRFLRELSRDGYARLHPVPEVSQAIQQALRERPQTKRLDPLVHIRSAVTRLL
ncbi:MAG: ELM1/GtrOC1 family putative glycosyltransferase [Candidatus Omnitrophota bacterium]|nr:ELM1/GtrOC1 family putative glycosyltransferase [Candidatus Omnitrophota bacterium]